MSVSRPCVLSVLLTNLLVAACVQDEAPASVAPVIRPVRYERVISTGAVRERGFSGIAAAGAEVNLSFRVPGTVSELAIEVGDRIREGQMIARLDRRDYELQVEDVQASLAQARAQARNARADLERIRSLYENNNATRDDMDAALTAAESFDATVSSVEKRLELAELQLSYCDLISRIDGAVAEVRAEVNENIGAGQVIALVTSGAFPEVEIAIPESLISQVSEGDRASVQFDAFAQESFTAVVTEVGVAPTRSATTFPVRLRVTRADSRILPGMAAEAILRLGSEDAASRVVVPAEAVGEDTVGNFVYTISLGAEGTASVQRRDVLVGQLLTEGLEILEGLDEEELIVTAGVDRIEDGQSVRIESPRG